MSKDEIKPDDLARILIGDIPGSYFIEVIIRTLFVFLLLMVCMRLLGKRMSSQLNSNEMVSVTTLASAIGIPLQSVDRGLIPAIIIALVVVFSGRWIAHWATKNDKFERFTQGRIGNLVNNSVMDVKSMLRVRIPRERVVAELRFRGITHLGMVKRLYIEADGNFSVILDTDPKPGLTLLPAWDNDFGKEQVQHNEAIVCEWCGNPQGEQKVCGNCESDKWMPAISEPQ